MMGQEPEITKTDPRGYYLWLQTQGVPPMQAIQMVEQRFGPPKSQDEINKENARKQQSNVLAQTGGMIAGVIAGRYVMNNAGKWLDKLTGQEVAQEVVENAAKQTGETVATTGGQTAAAAPQSTGQGISQLNKYFTKLDPGQIPQGQQVPEGMTAIRSNADGTVQVVPTESLNDASFLDSVNWGSVAQGGVGLLQAYQGYQAYKQGDYAGAGIYGAAGAGNIAASGALGASASGAAGSAAGGYLIPGLNIVAGAYGGYQTAEALSDMAAGSKRTQTGVVGGAASGAAIGGAVGSVVPGVGTAIGAGVGAVVGGIAGAIGSWTGSSKGKAQVMRDGIRSVLQQGNILDQDFKGTLADGSKYDFGKDGSTLKWKEIDKIAEANPAAWQPTVQLTDALAAAYGFVGQKASDISAWYAKAAVSNANDNPLTAIQNAQHFAQQQGITFDLIKTKLDEALKDNRINQSQYDYYLGGASQLTAGQTQPQPPPQPQPQTRPPAPLPENVQGLGQEQPKKKESISEMLRRYANKD